MKKIINGKRYDTGTAQLVGTYTNGYGCRDFNFIGEDLYRKKTGEFFLHGQGGALTEYAQTVGESVGGGDKIIPLSIEEAQEWAEDHLTGDEYEQIFNVEDEDNVQFSLLLPLSVHEKLKNESEKTGKTMTSLIIDSINKNLR